MKLILTHSNADFDAIAALLAAYKLNQQAVPIVPERLNRNVHNFLLLYRNGLPFEVNQRFEGAAVESVLLVDTQRLTHAEDLPRNAPLEIIDHHAPYERNDLKPHETFTSEPVGATTTILVEHIQQQNILLTALEATLLALGIYEDTGSLTYSTTTPRDARAVAWLLAQHAALDTIRRFLAPPLDGRQQALLDFLMNHAESRVIKGHTITVGAAEAEEHISEISSVVHRLRDMLDSAALFVLVQMPESLLLVCRSNDTVVDVGAIATLFGGGGHPRAAAATIYDQSLDEVKTQIWQHIHDYVRPIAQVADLMSYRVQTVQADQTVREIAQFMRRIGHEGYPVLAEERVIGLLTRRQLDRALEHNLDSLTLREIMTAGEVTLRPNDSVQTLEHKMVESGWGQIPVVDAQSHLMGIVTRTDLINHWASTHEAQAIAPPRVTHEQFQAVLGSAVTHLIETIAEGAQKLNLSLYLVGGAVRDLLLNRSNLDIDFVVEGQAVDLVNHLSDQYGGEIHSYRPFGTAKWLLDDHVARQLGVALAELPSHIDFASSRSEFYEHPTALPTVYQSSIKLDLQRRDFTINTLAIQLSPSSGEVLDMFGGLEDLRSGLIRVLHSLSFVDDPTRILRALRFEHRLGFKIEARTAELIANALPMLRRITGERLRNELELLLNEAYPTRALLRMQHLGVLAAIHPAFVIPEDFNRLFRATRQQPPWPQDMPDRVYLFWHILATTLPLADLPDFCDRLLFGRRMTNSLLDAALLTQRAADLLASAEKPSQVVQELDSRSHTAILTTWLLVEDQQVRAHLEKYMLTWREVQPLTNGHDLRARGLKPGPCYSRILSQLRSAWLDGIVTTPEQEMHLLEKLIEEEIDCHDDA